VFSGLYVLEANMAEVLAVPSAIAGLLNLTITTVELSHRYFSSVKSAPKAVKAYFRELKQLKDVLLEFKKLALHPDTAQYISPVNATESEVCREELERLCAKLQKRSLGGTFSQSVNRLTWPFSEEEIARSVGALSRYQNSITAILNVGNLRLSAANLSAVKHLQELQIEDRAQVSYQWLSKLNPASNHHFARTKHSQGTGQWFLELPQFKSWFGSSCMSLWLHAISGAGKTVLCSTVIEHVREAQPDEAIAYFYLNHSDSSTSTLDACLRSLLAQLCFFHTTMPTVVAELKSLSENPGRNGFLGNQELLHAVLSVCSGLRRCRIAIDALDEATERPELLEAIKVLAASSSVSLLVTSRRERDIEETLSDVIDYSVALRSTELQSDIGAYVVERLRIEPKLKRLPQSVKNRIEEVLTIKSQGM
jgi:ankyrin repeat domain-containing protein 50